MYLGTLDFSGKLIIPHSSIQLSGVCKKKQSCSLATSGMSQGFFLISEHESDCILNSPLETCHVKPSCKRLELEICTFGQLDDLLDRRVLFF